MSEEGVTNSSPNRDNFDLNLIASNIQDLFALTTQIRRIQAAMIDLLKVKGLITSEEFVAAHEGVVSFGLKDVGKRQKALSVVLQSSRIATKNIK